MSILDLIFPKRCVSCGKLGRYFCAKCANQIEIIDKYICPVCSYPAMDGATHPKCKTRYCLDGLISFFRYKGIIKAGIKKIKYRFVSDLAEELVSLIPKKLMQSITNNQQLTTNNTILIPVPLHPSRLKFRGFNQAEVLGRILAKRWNIPVRIDILKRVKKTVPQVAVKDRKKRLKNMENVFSIAHNILISQYPNILLFDDVYTTGATLRSAANVLKRAGAKKVWGISLAHG